jgi:hypothetical protein
VAEAFQLAHHDCRPLGFGQRPQLPDQLGQFFATLQLLGRVAPAGKRLGQRLRSGRAGAKVVERGVADDPVEPGAQFDLRVVAPQRQQRLREGVLGDVLGPASNAVS